MVYTVSGYIASVIITVVLLFLSPYTYSADRKIEAGTVISQIFTYDREMFFESPNHSAANVCGNSEAIWFTMFLPLICSLPFLPRLSAELKGNYRLKLSRERSYKKYWNKTFIHSVLSGAFSVTAGYLIYCGMIYCYYPHNSYFPDRATLDEDSREYYEMGRQKLFSFLNDLFDTQNEYVYVLNQAINVFAYAVMISALCLLLYLLMRNKYRALGIPIMVLYLADWITSGLILDFHRWAWSLNPKDFIFLTSISLDEYWNISPGWYFVILAIPVALFYFAGGAIFRKRVSN